MMLNSFLLALTHWAMNREYEIEQILRSALLLPYAPLVVQEWLCGPNLESRLAGFANSYTDKFWTGLTDSTVRGVYCVNCFAKLGECAGGALKRSCPFCKRYSRQHSLAAVAINNVLIGTYAESTVCKVLDEYHRIWSISNEYQQTNARTGTPVEGEHCS